MTDTPGTNTMTIEVTIKNNDKGKCIAVYFSELQRDTGARRDFNVGVITPGGQVTLACHLLRDIIIREVMPT